MTAFSETTDAFDECVKCNPHAVTRRDAITRDRRPDSSREGRVDRGLRDGQPAVTRRASSLHAQYRTASVHTGQAAPTPTHAIDRAWSHQHGRRRGA